jgi:hypothetical protein
MRGARKRYPSYSHSGWYQQRPSKKPPTLGVLLNSKQRTWIFTSHGSNNNRKYSLTSTGAVLEEACETDYRVTNNIQNILVSTERSPFI